jgi:hypothetical protein
MRFALYTLTVGAAVAASAQPAQAFGRGAAFRGASFGPAGGFRTAGVAHGAAVGPLGGAHAGTVHGGTYYGPGGTTVQHAGRQGLTVGPWGGVHAGNAGVTRVTGPGGNTYTTGHRTGATVGPAGNVAAHNVRGGVTVGPAGVVTAGSRGGVIATPWGTTAGIQRGGIAIGPGGVYAGGTRVVGHTTGYISPGVMRTSAFAVRTGGYYPYFNRAWYAGHTAAWFAPRWVAGYNLWVPPAWNSLVTFIGIPTAVPVSYDYGSTVVINDNSVYVNGDAAGTPEEYATRATTIADAGRAAKPAETDEWQPLGVFGMIQPDDKVAQRIFQLAVNKDGVVRGNYYDAVADSNTPVYGSVDKKSQRVAWSIGEKKDIVFETGLPNLTKDESTVLIHYGKDRTEQQMLVRIEEPKDKK